MTNLPPMLSPAEMARKLAGAGRLAAGMTALSEGRLADAAQLFTEAVAAMPADCGPMAALASVHNLQGHFAEARQICEQGLKLQPGHPVLLTELGNAFTGEGRTGAACRAFRQVLRRSPKMLAAREGLGRAAYAEGRFEEAAAAWQAVCAARPDYPMGQLHLGHALRAAGQPEAALTAFARVPQDDPAAAEAAYGRGCALQHLGRLEEAKAALHTAIRLRPDSGRYHRMLAGLKHFTAGDPQLAELHTLADKADSLPLGEQTELHFAIARALEDLQDYPAAFDHLRQGNALKRSQIRYDEAAQLGILQRVAAAYPADMSAPAGGCDSSVPIFIIGMPRSGTSLLEQILASHPDVHGAGETPLFAQTLRACHADPLGLTPPAAAEDCLRIGVQYAESLRARAPAAKRIVDKMPGNFLYAGLIRRTLPNAKILHIQRNAEDCCLSCFATLFTAGHNYAYDLTELGRYYRGYQEVMRHWRAVLPEGAMLHIRYEDLVDDLPGTLKQILSFCDLSWDAHCLSFQNTPRPVMTASAAQVRQPLNRRGIGRAEFYATGLAPLRLALSA